MKAEAFLFELALKRPFSTSRHTTDKSRNLLIRLEQDGAAGVGEAASRGLKLTGDNHRLNADLIPDLLAALNGHELRAEDPQGALAEVERIYAGLEGIARLKAAPSDKWKPFRGLLSGFDIALLDLAAKRLGITVSELLGAARDTIGPTASTCSTTLSGRGMQLRFLRQAQRFSAYRCKGDSDVEANMRRLDAMRAANSASGRSLAFWLDLNEALPRDRGPDFIERLVAWMGQHPSPEQELILEQPVKKRFVRTLCAMQKQADETLDPPPLNGSTLKYGFDHEGGPR